MNVCLKCFRKSTGHEGWEFYNRDEILYVKLTKQGVECDVCHEKKPIIVQAVRKLMDPWHGNPPPGWIKVDEEEPDIRAENTDINEEGPSQN